MNSNTGSKCAVRVENREARLQPFGEMESLESRVLLSVSIANEIPDVLVQEDAGDTVLDVSDVFEASGGGEALLTFDPAMPTGTPTVVYEGLTFTNLFGGSLSTNGSLGFLFANIPGASQGNAMAFGYAQTGLRIEFPAPVDSFSILLVEGPVTPTWTLTALDGVGGTVLGSTTVTQAATNQAVQAELAVSGMSVVEIYETTYNGNLTFMDDLRYGDPSGGSGEVTLSIAGNTNPALVTPNLVGTDLTLTYAPDSFGEATITVLATEDATGETVTDEFVVTVDNLVDLAGVVYEDVNGSGAQDSGEIGLEAVTVELYDQDTQTLLGTEVTDAAGAYRFDANLGAGTYQIVQTQPEDLVDGDETAGSLGGTVSAALDSNAIADIVVGAPGSTADGEGYDFAELPPSAVSGLVWEDFNADGEVNFGEAGVEGVTVTLTGVDHRGEPVNRTQQSDEQGVYDFAMLRPGEYAVTETQPEGIADSGEVLGEVFQQGVGLGPVGQIAGDDAFTGVVLALPDSQAVNYNFGERAAEAGEVTRGQTATVGFWRNYRGQALIRSLNGGADDTQLGDWLAATLPNAFGRLAGKTNAQIARGFKYLFWRLEAQYLAAALAVYVTNQTLAGTTAEAYGFLVDETGLGTSTINVGCSGEAFGVADYTEMTVLDLLRATDQRTSADGRLYDNGDGRINFGEAVLRLQAYWIYAWLNWSGRI